MPVKKAAQRQEPHPVPERQRREAGPAYPIPGPGAGVPGEPGRPYRAFVEREARKYWQQESGVIGSLVKPLREEIRAAALPILCLALRNRRGSSRHQAVAALVQHTWEQGRIKSLFAEADESPTYIDALIELARDARWSAEAEATKAAINRQIQSALDTGSINSRLAAQLKSAVWRTGEIDSLCRLYDLLARVTRQFHRARHLRVDTRPWITWATIYHINAIDFELDAQPVPAGIVIPVFALGEKCGLDYKGIEYEIKQYLRAFCHPFVAGAVNDMEFGRGRPVAGHPGLMQAGAGIHAVGSCSIFYRVNEDRSQIRIVGIGYHLERNIYRMEYASAELVRPDPVTRSLPVANHYSPFRGRVSFDCELGVLRIEEV